MPETDFMDTEPPKRNGWHFSREIQLGHIVTTVMLLLSAVIYVQKQDQRLGLIEYQISEQVKRDDRQDARDLTNMHDMSDRLDKIEGKLDRIIERNNLLNGTGNPHARP
jgi:hypothetical protein